MNTNDPRWDLIRRCHDGESLPDDLVALESCLRDDADFRDAYVRYMNLDVALSTAAVASSASMSENPRLRSRWRPFAAVAAGIVVGILCTSAVFAYVAPRAPKSVMLLEEGFESASAPVGKDAALAVGIWRVNFAEIVGEKDGVKPASGGKMLRFRRADHQGKARPAGHHVADAYRLIDVRSYRRMFEDGGAVVDVSACFNAIPFPPDEDYGCAVSIYAVDAETAPNGPLHIGATLASDSLAMARSSSTRLDRNSASWQRLTTELRLPAKTEFLVVRLHISQAFDSLEKTTFTGSYADDVRVSLMRRAPLP